MAQANMEGKVCVNHPDTAAESRCTSCFKPICSVCIVEVQSEHFCTKECANKHFQNLTHQANLAKKSGGGSTVIRMIIYLVILAALVFAIYHFVLKKGGTADNPDPNTPTENTTE